MKFKKYYEYTTSINSRLDKVFTDLKLPFNAFVDKGRCGIGGTWLALMMAYHTIITVPNNSIITSKMNEAHKYPNGMFAVEGGVTVQKIKEYLLKVLNTPGGYIKIMSTPDSFGNIIEAAKDIQKEITGFDIYRDCFLLIDEVHTTITEAYRERILVPFEYFWKFKNKSVISATPYIFSDPRFNEFSYHKVKFHEPYITQVEIVNSVSVEATLQKLLSAPSLFPGNVHIFLNSVTDSIEAIKRAELTEANMFYADKKENHEKLEGFTYLYQDEPMPEVYKKFNFYTCKYFEGWDLNDDNATIIFLTDIHSPHTRTRIPIKGIQAVGRLRTIPHKIYHITNHRSANTMKIQEQLESSFKTQADMLIKIYNQCVDEGEEMLPDIKKQTLKFSDITEGKAVFNHNKFDQIVNIALTNEEYANIAIIGDLWKAGLYEPVFTSYAERLEPTKRHAQRLSKADKLKELIGEFERLEKEKETIAFNLGYDELNNLIKENAWAYSIFKDLGKDRLTELGFKEKAIKAEMITTSNATAEMKLKKLLCEQFYINQRYTKDGIKQKLQRLYNLVGLKDKNGNIKTATAEQLGDNGRFEIRACKINVNDKLVPGFIIGAMKFRLTIAA